MMIISIRKQNIVAVVLNLDCNQTLAMAEEISFIGTLALLWPLLSIWGAS